jgi:hypothetical protein
MPASVDDCPRVMSDTYPPNHGVDGLYMDDIRARHLIVLDNRALGQRGIEAVCFAFFDPGE